MERILSGIMLGTLVFAQFSSAQATPSQTDTQSKQASEDMPKVPSTMPAPPRGRSTVIGGEIRSVDPVLDQLTLKAYGEKPFKIFFDERTEVYRDGKKISLLDLHPADHASIQTTLDGTAVFALSIHVLSKSPEGDYQGRILNRNPTTGELTVASSLSRQPIKLQVDGNTVIKRTGQASFASSTTGVSDLVSGALVSIKFASDKQGKGVATEITVLATPGSTFVFGGSLLTFDMHTGSLTIVDPRDEKNYSISFNPARFPISETFHNGMNLRVTATFDGTNYSATDITAMP